MTGFRKVSQYVGRKRIGTFFPCQSERFPNGLRFKCISDGQFDTAMHCSTDKLKNKMHTISNPSGSLFFKPKEVFCVPDEN